MKLLLASLAVVMLGSEAICEGWQNQYLANFGDMHMIPVEKSESQETEAYVTHSYPERMLLAIGCSIYSTQNKWPISHLRLGNGSPFLKEGMELVAVFDGNEKINLGWFGYARGGYTGSLTPQILARFFLHDNIRIEANDSGFAVEFTLENAANAIQNVRCLDLGG